MMSTQNQTNLPIVGYTDRLSVAPDENIRFMVSCDAAEYQLEIVRLRHGHPNPAGPGFKEQVVPASIAGKYMGKKQHLYPGSYGIVPDSPSLSLTGSFTIQAWIYPTTVNKGLQAIVTKWSPAQDIGYGMFLDENGCLAIWLGDDNGQLTKVSSGVPLRDLYWYFVAATFDQARHEVTLLQRPMMEWPLSLATQVRHDSVSLTKLGTNSVPLLIAAAWQPSHGGNDRPGDHFNGKIGNPSLFQTSLKPDQLDALMHGQSPRHFGEALLVSWDFSAGIGTDTITDVSGHDLHGKTVNLPARGVTGHNWNGCESNFAHALGEYGAIHFHEDDLADAAWDVAADFAIPSTMPSGVYAARLSSSNGMYLSLCDPVVAPPPLRSPSWRPPFPILLTPTCTQAYPACSASTTINVTAPALVTPPAFDHFWTSIPNTSSSTGRTVAPTVATFAPTFRSSIGWTPTIFPTT
jgi:N,N-dimethylformamidase